MVVRLHAQVDDLADVDEDRAVGGLDLHPALATLLERVAQAAQHLLGQAQGQHLTALEAECGATYDVGTQCASTGWTSSVKTPPAVFGCRNATCVPRMPVRGVSSISRSPASRAAPSAPSTSSTWYATWCRPGPLAARKRPTGVSSES